MKVGKKSVILLLHGLQIGISLLPFKPPKASVVSPRTLRSCRLSSHISQHQKLRISLTNYAALLNTLAYYLDMRTSLLFLKLVVIFQTKLL